MIPSPQLAEARLLNSAIQEKINGIAEMLSHEMAEKKLTSEEKVFYSTLQRLGAWHAEAEEFIKNYLRQ